MLLQRYVLAGLRLNITSSNQLLFNVYLNVSCVSMLGFVYIFHMEAAILNFFLGFPHIVAGAKTISFSRRKNIIFFRFMFHVDFTTNITRLSQNTYQVLIHTHAMYPKEYPHFNGSLRTVAFLNKWSFFLFYVLNRIVTSTYLYLNTPDSRYLCFYLLLKFKIAVYL